MLQRMNRECRFFVSLCLFTGFLCFPASLAAEPWWTKQTLESSEEFYSNINYRLMMYEAPTASPVRAHILHVTGLGTDYIFGVLGSFGVLIPPTTFAKQSNAFGHGQRRFFSPNNRRAREDWLSPTTACSIHPMPAGPIRGAAGFKPNGILIDWIAPDDVSGFVFSSSKPGWDECHSALGAGPILVKKGVSRIDVSEEGFNKTQRAPRTAIGSRADGSVILIVVDGRQPLWSAGVTLSELAELFLAEQAEEAMNLDGGGSSTLVIDQKIINHPSDLTPLGTPGKERAVANVVALFKRN